LVIKLAQTMHSLVLLDQTEPERQEPSPRAQVLLIHLHPNWMH